MKHIVTLGPEGTFSHAAVRTLYPEAEVVFEETLEGVFSKIENKTVEAIVVPLQNSVSGFIDTTVYHLVDTKCYINDELVMLIEHQLSGFGKIEQAKTLLVHPQTYEQCKKSIQKLIPECEVVYTSSNAASARELKKKHDSSIVAIIPSYAARIYSLPILQEDIQDSSKNQTRFVVLSRKEKAPTEDDKSSFLVLGDIDKKNENEILDATKKREVEIITFEEVKYEDPPLSLYFLEIGIGHSDPIFQAIKQDLEEKFKVKFLGSYPRFRP